MKGSIWGLFDRNKRNRQIFGPGREVMALIYLIGIFIITLLIFLYINRGDYKKEDADKNAENDIREKEKEMLSKLEGKTADEILEEARKDEPAAAAADSGAGANASTDADANTDVKNADLNIEDMEDNYSYSDMCQAAISDQKNDILNTKLFFDEAEATYSKQASEIEREKAKLDEAAANLKDERSKLAGMKENCQKYGRPVE